jgi:hypothetical protein
MKSRSTISSSAPFPVFIPPAAVESENTRSVSEPGKELNLKRHRSNPKAPRQLLPALPPAVPAGLGEAPLNTPVEKRSRHRRGAASSRAGAQKNENSIADPQIPLNWDGARVPRASSPVRSMAFTVGRGPCPAPGALARLCGIRSTAKMSEGQPGAGCGPGSALLHKSGGHDVVELGEPRHQVLIGPSSTRPASRNFPLGRNSP